MSNSRTKVMDRFLSVLLALVMVVGMLPVTVFASAADYEGQYVITVKEKGGSAISEATIAYQIKVDSSERKSSSVQTDTEGKAGIDLTEYQSELDEGKQIDIAYTVTKADYTSKSGEIKVDNISGTSEIEMEAVAEPTEQVTVTVTVTGGENGTVKLNDSVQNSVTVDKGTNVTVELTPNQNCYIKSLTVGGEEKSVEKGQTYTDTIQPTEATEISVTFIEEVTVSVSANEGGKVLLNGGEEKSVTVDKNASVPLKVTPDSGYQISSVTIGGKPESITNLYSFEKSITADKDVAINVAFVKEWVIEVSYNEESGTVTTAPENQGGSVTVQAGTSVTVTATPNLNCRVSKVTINDEDTVFDDNTYSHIGDAVKPYTNELTADKNYTIKIVFAPTCFNVTYESDENGEVVIENAKVDYDNGTSAKITAKGNYNITNVYVNGSAVTFIRMDDRTVGITINNITEDKKITVDYKKMEESSELPKDIAAFNDSAVRIDEKSGIYVYKKDATVAFKTNYDGIAINEITDGTQFKTKSVDVSKTTIIERIYLFYEDAWHIIKPDTPIKIVIDNEIKKPTLTPEAPHANDYYNKDVKVDILAEDIGDYSGIAKIEYRITSNGAETVKSTEIYSNDGSDEILAKVEKAITIDAAINNSDNVIVYLNVIDLAGNEEETSCQLKINSTPPQISVKIDGTLHSEAEKGYYNAKRTATVTYTDRASTFDQNAAEKGIDITGIDGNKAPVSLSKAAMISWSHNNDVHIATIEFATDANYEWSISYTNKAGLSNNAIVDVTGDSVYNFTVDTKAPSSATIELDGNMWGEIVSFLTFGLWKNYPVTATVTETKDSISPVKDAVYYKDAGDSILSEAELDLHFTNGDFVSDPYTISSDEKLVIYAKVTDYAGNTKYISTNGVVYDKTESSIDIKPEEPNANGIYTDDVKVTISVDDTIQADSVSSGIKKIDYKVESVFADGSKPVVTDSGTLYDFSKDKDIPDSSNPTYEQLKKEWSDTLTIDAETNNSDKVTITVTVEDNAGNKYEKTIEQPLTIVVDKPTAAIVFGDDDYKENRHDDSYFIEQSAKIIVTDRKASFNPERAFEGITITATNSAGGNINPVAGEDYTISDEWAYSVVESRETHTATIQFLTDGNYKIVFNYLNNSDKEENRIVIDDKSFTKDATDPTGSIKVAENTWDKLLSVLTFGLYSNVKVDVTATADDATSPVKIEYYKTSDPSPLSKTDLDKQTFTLYEQQFSVEPNEQFVIYLKITDYAGNYIYISSDGYIVDETASKIEITPNASNSNDCYNGDVEVGIKVSETEPYSGIQKIEYWVECDENKTQQKTLYNFDYKRESTEDGKNTNGGKLTITDWATGEEVITEYEDYVPTREQLCSSWAGKITVDSSLNNSSDVILYVKATDNAGNSHTESVSLDVDITAPVIQISYPSTDKDNNGNTYFDHARQATIVITERADHFDSSAATAGILITAKNAKGEDVESPYTISSWTTEEGNSPDEATHTATIDFTADANYTLTLSYTDMAGNPHTEDEENPNDAVVVKEGSVAPFKFTVDTKAPTGTVKAKSAEGREETWKDLLSSLTYGFWSNEKITVTGSKDDETSNPELASIEYYKVTSQNAKDNVEALSKEALDAVTTWTPFEKVEVAANEQFVLYLKITDLAGNYTYICTDGLIVDDQAPIEETIAPEITVNPEQPVNGLYNSDVDVAIEVEDPLVGGTYSGLRTVSYRVLNMGEETKSDTLYTFNVKNPSQSDLCQKWEGSITVDRTLNNSNDVKIEVIAEDNSGNTSRKDVSIKIDITAPKIDVSYNNNAADSNSFFKADRTATVVVTERNFDPKDVKVTITNTDGVIPSLSEWKQTSEGTGNQDDATWAATITYSADGDYTFDITYTDLATNLMSGVSYGESVAPTNFTIDKTLPTISVSYSNNEAANGKYFKAPRTATVTINEHNFDVNRVTFTRTATLDGATITLPAISWTNNGDVHTATIPYMADGDYTFDVTMLDLAGNQSAAANYGNSVASKDFTVDQTIVKPTITGVEDGHAYKDDAIPNISFSDVNYDSYEVKLTRTRKDEIGVDVTSQFIDAIGVDAKGGSKSFDTFKREVENDGIYTLTVRMLDKAGNEETQSLTFTVNRFGSVYEYGSYLISLIQDGGAYVGSITDDLIITEYNANRLVNDSLNIEITLDGRSIDAKYVADPVPNANVSVGQSGWFQYQYTISKDNFDADGMYRITLSSEDEAANTPESNPDNSTDENGNAIVDTMQFRVDSTAPEITSVVGLESKIINEQKVDVRYTVYDAIGLKSITVYLDGKAQDPITTFDDINNYSGTFTISESSSAQKVRILVEDKAGNKMDTDDFGKEDADGNVIVPMPAYSFNNTVTVSTNFFVRWYANKPLFWGSIGGVVGLAAVIWILIVLLKKKRKNNEEK